MFNGMVVIDRKVPSCSVWSKFSVSSQGLCGVPCNSAPFELPREQNVVFEKGDVALSLPRFKELSAWKSSQRSSSKDLLLYSGMAEIDLYSCRGVPILAISISPVFRH